MSCRLDVEGGECGPQLLGPVNGAGQRGQVLGDPYPSTVGPVLLVGDLTDDGDGHLGGRPHAVRRRVQLDEDAGVEAPAADRRVRLAGPGTGLDDAALDEEVAVLGQGDVPASCGVGGQGAAQRPGDEKLGQVARRGVPGADDASVEELGHHLGIPSEQRRDRQVPHVVVGGRHTPIVCRPRRRCQEAHRRRDDRMAT